MCACLAYRHPLPKWSCRDKASLPTHASPYRYDARCSPAGVWRAAGTRDVVDLVDPSDALAREHAQDMIGIEHAVAEGHAKGDGFSRDGVLCIHLAGRDDVLDLSNERIIEPFIGIEVEYPVGICLLECKIALR